MGGREGREGREGGRGGREGGRKEGEGMEGGWERDGGREGGEGGREEGEGGRGWREGGRGGRGGREVGVFKCQSRHILRNNVSRCLPMTPQYLKNNHVTYYVITQVGVYAAQQYCVGPSYACGTETML